MGNNQSKHIVQGTTAVQEDKELVRIRKLEKDILDLKRSNADLLKKYNTTKDQLSQLQQEVKPKPVGAEETGHGKETQDEYIQQLIREIKVKENIIKKLREDNTSKGDLEKKVKELQQKNSQLQSSLKDARKHLQQKGEVCERDCVLSCLLWICHNKLDVHPCGRHLEKILTYTVAKQIKPTNLRCNACISILKKCKIADKILNVTYSSSSPTAMKDRDKKINEAWEKLVESAEKHVLIVSKVISKDKRMGHCVLYDGNQTYYDLQKDMVEKWNQDSFKSFLEDSEGIILYTVNLENFKKIIEDHRDSLHEICNTSPTGTGCNCMPVAHVPSPTDQVPSPTDQVPSPTDQVTSNGVVPTF